MNNPELETLRSLYKGFQRFDTPNHMALEYAIRAYGAMVLTPDELIALLREYETQKHNHYSQG